MGLKVTKKMAENSNEPMRKLIREIIAEQQSDFAKMIEKKFQEALRLTENSFLETKDQIENMCKGNLKTKGPRGEYEGAGEVVHFQRNQDEDIRVDIPEFNGKLNPEEYLEWLNAVERMFELKAWDEFKQYKMVILKLKSFASTWFESLQSSRVRGGKGKIRTWPKLKKHLNNKFLPKDFEQEMFLKLTKLRQGPLTVEEYIREFERLTLLCDLQEKNSQTKLRQGP